MLTRKIALLAANPAFGTIVADALHSEARLKVFAFQTPEALSTFMRISPIDLVILDAEGLPADVTALVGALREQPRQFQQDLSVMLLTRAAPAFHAALLAQGIDLVHGKPVSPARLLESVKTQLQMRAAGPIIDGVYRGPERRRRKGAVRAAVAPAMQDNVVQLFGRTSSIG